MFLEKLWFGFCMQVATCSDRPKLNAALEGMRRNRGHPAIHVGLGRNSSDPDMA